MAIRYCSLASGSSGNCHFISSGKTRVLVDIGRSAHYICDSLNQIGEDIKGIQAVFISHEHLDHISGLGPLARKHEFMIIMHKATYNKIAYQLNGIKENRIRLIDDGSYYFNDFEIGAFSLSHDAEYTLGFTFFDGSSKIGIATDLGCIDNEVVQNLQNCKLISIDSNYDERMLWNGYYPQKTKERISSSKGHLSNKDVGDFLAIYLEYRYARNVILAHMSLENNDPILAMNTIQDILQDSGINVEKDLHLEVAPRNRNSNLYTVF